MLYKFDSSKFDLEYQSRLSLLNKKTHFTQVFGLELFVLVNIYPQEQTCYEQSLSFLSNSQTNDFKGTFRLEEP